MLAMRIWLCEAPGAGVVRATTERFCTAADGRAACEFTLAAPSELCCVGLIPTELVTFAPFSEASVTWKAPRLIIWLLPKESRFATVTAWTLWAFT